MDVSLHSLIRALEALERGPFKFPEDPPGAATVATSTPQDEPVTLSPRTAGARHPFEDVQ